MKIWVLVDGVEGEGHNIVAAFTTKELAWDAMTDLALQKHLTDHPYRSWSLTWRGVGDERWPEWTSGCNYLEVVDVDLYDESTEKFTALSATESQSRFEREIV